MINFTRILSTAIKAGRNLAKFRLFGPDDVREKPIAAPYGVDGNPIKKMVGIYAKTGEDGKGVLLGFIQENALADPGELRLFATDENGVEKAFIWLTNSGTIELNGNADNLVRYSKLKQGFDQLRNDFNSLIADYNGHTHPVTSAPGTTGPVAVPLSGSSASIVTSKINDLKSS